MTAQMNSKLAVFKKMIGQKLTNTPSPAGNWLA